MSSVVFQESLSGLQEIDVSVHNNLINHLSNHVLPILRMYTGLQNNKYTIPFASILTVNYLKTFTVLYRVIEPLSHEGTRVRIGSQYQFIASKGDLTGFYIR